MPKLPENPTPKELQKAYAEGMQGWIWNKIEEARWDAFCASLPSADDTLAKIKDTHKVHPRVLLHLSRLKYDPNCWAEEAQTGPDCTSHGSRCAVDVTRSVEIDIKGEPETYFKRSATEPTYGARGGSGDGMAPTDAANFHKKYGFLVRQNYPGVVDLTKYNFSIGDKWGARGVPEAVKKLCMEHNVGELVVPRYVEQSLDCLANGYAGHSGQNWGCSEKQPKDGINRRSTGWSHDMGNTGYDLTCEYFKDPVVFVPNSWACYHPDTEVLTAGGWKNITKITKNDILATLNLKTDELEYQTPSEIHCHDYSGMLYRYEGHGIDLLVTPNHNLVCGLRHRDSWGLKQADSVPQHFKMKKSAKIWKGIRLKGKRIGEVYISGDDYMRLLGWYISEGHTYRRSRTRTYAKISGGSTTIPVNEWLTGITQIKPAPELDALMIRLRRLGFRKESKGYVTNNKSVYEEFAYLGRKSWKKKLPKQFRYLCTSQLEILFDAMMQGDGYRGEQWTYYTSSKTLANQVQEICLKIGIAADIYWVDRIGRDNGTGGITRHIEYQVSIKRTRTEPHCHEGWIPTKQKYNGKVYCATVPNHTLYVRRNGVACWSGNSWNQPNPIWLAHPEVYGPWVPGMIVVPLNEFDKYFVRSGSIYHYSNVKGFAIQNLPKSLLLASIF